MVTPKLCMELHAPPLPLIFHPPPPNKGPPSYFGNSPVPQSKAKFKIFHPLHTMNPIFSPSQMKNLPY